MTCKCGNYTRFAHVGGKCSDMAYFNVPHLKLEYDGYVPSIEGLGSGDYFEMTLCLDCGNLQEFTKLEDADIKRIIADAKGEDFDEETDENTKAELKSLAEEIKSTDMLRWLDTEIIGLAHTRLSSDVAKLIQNHFEGTSLWYKDEVVSELLDL